MFFSVITKNLNWEIFTKNLVLKDGMGLRVKILICEFTEKSDFFKFFFGRGGMKINVFGVNCLKKGERLEQLADLRGEFAKKRE